MNVPTFTNVKLVGMHFRQEVNAKAVVANMVPPVIVYYEREHYNPYDENAIKIIYNGDHIAYVERESAALIAPYVDDGVVFNVLVEELVEHRKNLYPIATFYPKPAEEISDTVEEKLEV